MKRTLAVIGTSQFLLCFFFILLSCNRNRHVNKYQSYAPVKNIKDTVIFKSDTSIEGRGHLLLNLRPWGIILGTDETTIYADSAPKQSYAFSDSLADMISGFWPWADKKRVILDIGHPLVKKIDTLVHTQNFSFAKKMQYFLWFIGWKEKFSYGLSSKRDTFYLQYSIHDDGIDWGYQSSQKKDAVRFLKEYFFKESDTRFFEFQETRYSSNKKGDSVKIKKANYSYSVVSN